MRIYRSMLAGEMDETRASKRVNILQVIHNMANAELQKRVEELEKRLIEAGKMPRRVAYAHE